ncbi:NUDIX hydrolase [Cupriavidus alkaliphilus]|uniref:NAD+ diphosphatase n=1 Tax=Cupriavidus alkaliphilus TaxID=942866 RepID=A0A1C3U2C4_9BURK|nr:NUDIX domain-containing protein [Cupriavidus alkaliphilus]MBB2916212.1 NAD+ diphosphatase [Cupriavidus alkaliphilus]MBB3005914.1 NAD+ diphosphatase [Cupriavidus alkaliphilus]MBB3012135.1 NAD+ diphosphatase [Cupriavidus alkaliphilus]PVY81384.1 NAD+ diphosphatase [Cupriavidus alkaliphilus]RAS10319.1 NAD+ diphosphatase [Cupriavidus alkaliphilus]
MTYRFCPQCGGPLELLPLSGRERHACVQQDCGFVHWNNPLPVLAAVVEYQDKLLLARNAAWPEKMFALVTGFLERDEPPELGVARELKEETNLDTESVALIGVYEFMRKNELIIAYHVKATGTVELSEELAEYKLVAPEDVRVWSAGTGFAVADWLAARGYPVRFFDRQTGADIPDPRRPHDFSQAGASLQYRW